MCVCVCVLLDIRGKITLLWPIVMRKLCEQLSLNPYSVHGGSKSKEEEGWVGNGQQKEKKRPDKYRPPHRPQPNQ